MGKRGNEKAKARGKIALFVASHTTRKGQVRVPWSPELADQLRRDHDSNGPELAGKPVGHPSTVEGVQRESRRVSPTEKPEGPRNDGDAETSPFAGRRDTRGEPDYVMPEPAVQGDSPSREVLAVIGDVSPVHSGNTD